MDDPSDSNLSANVNDRQGTGLPESTFDHDTMFDALSHERRRYVLYTLFEDDTWPLQALATKVAAWEASVPEADVVDKEVERVYASLYHAHVPKLVELDIIDFDRERETITRGDNAEQVLRVLDVTGASDEYALENHARETEND